MKEDWEDYWEEPEEIKRDHKIDEAKEELQNFFKEKNKDVFYMKQLEVKYEKQFFHWIIARAINELIDEGVLGYEMVPLRDATWVKFVFNRRHRYYKRQINRCLEVIKEYSNQNVAKACGRQAEVLFLNALAIKGFMPKGENINEYKGQKWSRTNHDWTLLLKEMKFLMVAR